MRQSLQVFDRNITAERREPCIAAAPAVGQPFFPGVARAELWGAPAGAPQSAAGAAAAGMIAPDPSSGGCAVLERAEEPASENRGTGGRAGGSAAQGLLRLYRKYLPLADGCGCGERHGL